VLIGSKKRSVRALTLEGFLVFIFLIDILHLLSHHNQEFVEINSTVAWINAISFEFYTLVQLLVIKRILRAKNRQYLIMYT
jgi:hypothetical protein